MVVEACVMASTGSLTVQAHGSVGTVTQEAEGTGNSLHLPLNFVVSLKVL